MKNSRVLQNRRILITGPDGFLGSYLVRTLKTHGYRRLILPSHSEYDLTQKERIRALFKKTRPEAVIHLAAIVGGIGANRESPGIFFYHNAVMGIELLERARLEGVLKFVAIGTVCSYPKFTPLPFRESAFWSGYPEETNAPYGLAKKMLLAQAQAYRRQYGMNAVYLVPVNLYGPGDDFDPRSSHVIPAMIRKFLEAKAARAAHVTLWGDGSASREFLYVGDCAEAVRMAFEKYDKPDPVNIGTGREIKIRTLARMIGGLTGFKGKIRWDASQPNGQPRRRLDVSRAAEEFGFRARTRLERGLTTTIRWYRRALKTRGIC